MGMSRRTGAQIVSPATIVVQAKVNTTYLSFVMLKDAPSAMDR